MKSATSSPNTRDRLLLAAAELLHESGGRSASTRAICERAGVQAPTLYHHFGSKQGLIDAVIQHGFNQYVDPAPSTGEPIDPIDSIRHGWDRHVQFGLDHPSFYALLYGNVERGRPCAITSPALSRLTELLRAAARRGQLRVPPEAAAAHLLAANVGVTLGLIAQPEEHTDLSLSYQAREAALAAICAEPTDEPSAAARSVGSGRAAAAIALAATLDDETDLSAGETALLRELLLRLATPPATAPR
jgi:AcrR family transcriptional regulator